MLSPPITELASTPPVDYSMKSAARKASRYSGSKESVLPRSPGAASCQGWRKDSDRSERSCSESLAPPQWNTAGHGAALEPRSIAAGDRQQGTPGKQQLISEATKHRRSEGKGKPIRGTKRRLMMWCSQPASQPASPPAAGQPTQKQ